MSVRAKFVCRSKTEELYGENPICTVKLEPVYPKDGVAGEENRKFFAATPYGSINLGCVNKSASEQFVLGAEYYVDFTPAATAAPTTIPGPPSPPKGPPMVG